ncbi:MAG: hypothetical protein HOP18_13565 [Deltaproteobacteria bacterium]|nr:hypothetical protein [Deltaproteobacteria bacterium]
MRTLETIAHVTNDGKVSVLVPSDLSQGEYRVVLVIDDQPVNKEKRTLLDFPVMSVGAWPENLSLRREDMYDEWGR